MGPTTNAPPVVLVGPESAGKSSLAAALSATRSRAQNVAGATVAVERFQGTDRVYLDTPGMVHRLDTATTDLALRAIDRTDDALVLLTLRATDLDDDLQELLPTVAGRRGIVVVTHWDRVEDTTAARRGLDGLAVATGTPFVPVDTRAAEPHLPAVRDALAAPGTFTRGPVLARAGWRIEPPPTLLDHRWVGPPLGLALLLAPAILAVWLATTVASAVEPAVVAVVEPIAGVAAGWPAPLDAVVAGDYGLITMGPLLLVWALPVVVVLALLLGVLRSDGGAPVGAPLRPDGA
jgi:ferrous iron transport protein B